MATHVERVVAYGDSLMLGLGTPTRHGWVHMLRQHYYEELNADVGTTRHPPIFYEIGAFATNAADLAAAVIGPETKQRFRIYGEKDGYDPTKRLSIVSVGVNDSYLLTEEGEHATPLEDFQRDIGTIATALAAQSQILYVGLLPCHEELRREFWDIKNTLPQLRSRELYEETAIDTFAAAGAQTIPATAQAANSAIYMNNISEDGIHGGVPSEQKVYEWVVRRFDDMVA